MTPPSQKTTRQSDTGGGSPLHITKFPSGVNLGSTAGGVEVAVPPAIGVVVDSGSVGWGGEAVGVAPEQETARRARAAEMRLTRITVPREGASGILARSLVGATGTQGRERRGAERTLTNPASGRTAARRTTTEPRGRARYCDAGDRPV